ncbi:MAG: hypothetical protein AAF945_11105 [Actinomycetota bacterium]
MKTSRIRPLVAIAALLLLLAPAGGTARATTGPYITFCKIEANGSWEILRVDYTWIMNGYRFQDGNIIPPFSVDLGTETISFPGMNLDTVYPSGHTGQEILDNGCEVPPPPAPPSSSTTTTTTTTTTTVPPTTSTPPPSTVPPAPGPPASTTTTTSTPPNGDAPPAPPAPPTTETPPAAPPAPPTTVEPPAPPAADPPESSPPSGGAPPRQSEPPIDPPDGPDLPNTGGSAVSGLVGTALVLLFAGSVLQVMGQRRRTS